MKRRLFLLSVCFALLLLPGFAQARQAGFSVTCDNGSSFDNGIEVTISQLRTGFSYRATAIGINGFDPVLAVLSTQSGRGLCDDDNTNASSYAADLPTTGRVPASNLSAQVDFTPPNTGNFADVSLVVGGYGNQSGEFILILEGMGVTSGDGAGDPFSINLTTGMVDSGVPLTVYMLARDTSLDPTIYRADSSLTAITDQSGNVIGCDDAGNADLCWGESVDLSSSSLTIQGGSLPGGPYDAMLNMIISGIALNSDRSQNYFNLLMTSSPTNATTGQYVLAFHIGMVEPQANNGKGSSDNNNNNGSNGNNGNNNTDFSGGGETVPTQSPQNSSSSNMGVSITCDNGASFDNGVQFFLYELPSDVTFTATAIGLNGFDPVLVVADAAGNGQCVDDADGAVEYAADLPTTGSLPGSALSAQVTFTQDTGEDTATMSIVVGGYGTNGGEFLLIFEGRDLKTSDQGHIYDVDITPPMVDSGVPMTVYVITEADSHLDAYIAQTDEELNIVTDRNGDTIACDDAGNSSLCWGNTPDLSNSSITLDGRELSGWEYDAMLSLDLAQAQFNVDEGQEYVTYVVDSTSSEATEGKYVIAFHIGRSS